MVLVNSTKIIHQNVNKKNSTQSSPSKLSLLFNPNFPSIQLPEQTLITSIFQGFTLNFDTCTQLNVCVLVSTGLNFVVHARECLLESVLLVLVSVATDLSEESAIHC